MRVRLKSQMFLIITPLIKELLKRTCFEFIICNRINLLRLCVKLELKVQRSHKVETVMSIEFDLLLQVSLQCYIQVLFEICLFGSFCNSIHFTTFCHILQRYCNSCNDITTFCNDIALKFWANYSPILRNFIAFTMRSSTMQIIAWF